MKANIKKKKWINWYKEAQSIYKEVYKRISFFTVGKLENANSKQKTLKPDKDKLLQKKKREREMAIKFISNNRSKNTVNISKDCKMVFETSTLLYQLSTEKENRKSEKKWRRPKHCQQTWPDIYITPYSITEKNILFKCTWTFTKRDHFLGHETVTYLKKKNEIIQSILSVYSKIKLQISKRQILENS